jgi:hypothetical protein
LCSDQKSESKTDKGDRKGADANVCRLMQEVLGVNRPERFTDDNVT